MLREEVKTDFSRLFDYNEKTGDLIWKHRSADLFKTIGSWKTWNTRFGGKVAGSIDKDGYVVVMMKGRPLRAHRIIWEMHYGSIPNGIKVDHINGLTGFNKLSNLRLASDSENKMNRHKDFNTYSGLKGVYPNKKNWCSKICIPMKKKMIHLGTYKTKAEAALAYAKASLRYHGKFSVYYRSLATNA